jgi:(1->4)-alpha-D-glucan 1-alpha-D-glucosylmutase
MAAAPRVPTATYRIQFNRDFALRRAAEIVGFLHELGISHVYASPLLKARPGSQHGYDVVDPTQLNPELDGREALEALSARLRQRGMGLLLDIVPNHMAAHPENPWWWDVLNNGRDSRYAAWFDIDWERGGGKVVLPVLGAPLAEVLDRGDLKVDTGITGPELRYYENRFPLTEAAAASAAGLERHGLRALLAEQHYELVFWRDGPRRVNYRRFFDVTELIGVRPEAREQFDASHELVLELAREGLISGLRIDHIDGLARPRAYLDALQERLGTPGGSYYVLVEKILAEDEVLPEGWPVAGTTGYDTLNVLNALWVDEQGCRRIFEHARERLGVVDFDEEMARCKWLVLERLFPGDLRTLAERLAAAAAEEFAVEQAERAIAALTVALGVYRTYIEPGGVSDQDRRVIERALMVAYKREPGLSGPLERLTKLILNPPARGPGVEFIERWQQFTGPVMAKGVEDTAMYRTIALTSLNEVGGHAAPPARAVERFHDVAGKICSTHPHRLNATSTHDTKRSEDVRCRISVLSELSSEWLDALERWSGLNADCTQEADGRRAPSQRDEVLIYQALLGTWPAAGEPGPDFTGRIKAYALKAAREAKLETSWTEPDRAYEEGLERFVQGVLQPGRSQFRAEFAKLHRRVAWYGALNSLAQTLLKLTMPGVPDIYQGTELWDLSLVDPDNRRPVDYGLRQRALAEIRTRSAEDPAALYRELLRAWPDGRIKLYLTTTLLRLRAANLELFGSGDYQSLRSSGELAEHVVAFARSQGGTTLVVAAGRLLARVLPEGVLEASRWVGTSLEFPRSGRWRDVLSGRLLDTRDTAAVEELFEDAPLAALISQ